MLKDKVTLMEKSQLDIIEQRLALHCAMCRDSFLHIKHTPIGSSIERLIQLEKALFRHLMHSSDWGVELEGHLLPHDEAIHGGKKYHNMNEFIQHTESIIGELKHTLLTVDNANVSKTLSYWLAAIQIEFDQINNYIR